MLWDDVVDESTPKKLFFSRVFYWLVSTKRETDGFGSSLKYVLVDNIDVRYQSLNKDSHAYKFYKTKPFTQAFDSSDEMMNIFDMLIKEISNATNSATYSFLESHKKGYDKPSLARSLPTFKRFKESICRLTSDDILKSLIVQTTFDNVQKPTYQIAVNGSKFDVYLLKLAMLESHIEYKKQNLHQYDAAGAREIKELERQNAEIYKEATRSNQLAVKQIESLAGFPYSPTIREYKRFLNTNFKTLFFKTLMGAVEIETNDFFDMLLFPVPTYKDEIISMRYPV